MTSDLKKKLKKIGNCTWEYEREGEMKVPARLFLSETLLNEVEEGAIKQAINVAHLPGIYKYSLSMPDMHFGYGFPIGGVAALDIKEGGLSPGGIGFDINCGVRVLRTNLLDKDIKPKLRELLEKIFKNIPSGVGREGKLRLTRGQLDDVLEEGARWAVNNNYGNEDDLKHAEEGGYLKFANHEKVSEKAKLRGLPQLGSLGAGNHFLEIQRVDKIYIPEIASKFGIERENQICVMIHTGSRGLGHQVCTDYLQILEKRFHNEIKKLPDRELIFAPSNTQECEDYFQAMCASANYAWANRQLITHWTRESFAEVLKMKQEDIGLELIYDVAHNIAKIEVHDGKKLYVHRKGATRAFPPGSEDLPSDYKEIGQPVLIPGSMGTASYILIGAETAKDTFYSTAHGAGRVSSRVSMVKSTRGEDVAKALEKKGIISKAASWKVLAEEAPEAYKNVDEVVRVTQEAGISRIIVRLVPIGVVKG